MEKDFRLKDYLLCVARVTPLQRVELEEALRASLAGQLTARRLLEERHLPHVIAWTLPYRSDRVAYLKLIEAGNRALLRTIKRWQGVDPVGFNEALQSAVEKACEELLTAPSRP